MSNEQDIINMIAGLEAQLRRMATRYRVHEMYNKDRTYLKRCQRIEERIEALEQELEGGSGG